MLSTSGLSGLMLWFALMKSGLMLEFRALEMNAGSLRTVHLPEGKYQDILILGDRHDTWHANQMYQQLIEVKGIPAENIVQIEEFSYSIRSASTGFTKFTNEGAEWLLSSDSNTITDMLSRTFIDLRSQVRVVGIPIFLGAFGNSSSQISLIDASNILFVFPSGNTHLMHDYFGIKEGDPRDLWQSNHPFWDTQTEYPFLDHAYFMDLLSTDNVIMASSHGFQWKENQSGDLTLTVFPGQHNMRCGEAKDNCFSLAVSSSPRTSYPNFLQHHAGSHTSGATVHLSAIAFYLAQFFPTAEEIVSVLRTCAIDVGEPGPDEEYGVGIVNLFCPEIFSQEAKVYAASLQSSGKSSPVLQELTHRSSPGLSFRSAVGLGFQGVEGYVGMSYTTPAFQATVLAGFSDAPFGIASRLHQQRTTFFEVGLRKPLIPHLSFVTTYGRQSGDFSLSSFRTGLHVTRPLGRVQTSFYVGRHTFFSSFGFPGYQAAGAQKVSFSRGVWEARFSLSFSL